MDSAVGDVLNAVRAHESLSTNTFAFLTSDNGAIPNTRDTVHTGDNGEQIVVIVLLC